MMQQHEQVAVAQWHVHTVRASRSARLRPLRSHCAPLFPTARALRSALAPLLSALAHRSRPLLRSCSAGLRPLLSRCARALRSHAALARCAPLRSRSARLRPLLARCASLSLRSAPARCSHAALARCAALSPVKGAGPRYNVSLWSPRGPRIHPYIYYIVVHGETTFYSRIRG